MKKLPLAALFGTACIYLSASPIVLAEDATELEEIVVTADRKARTVDETLAPVTIITRQDIEKYQASDIADVLRRVPGINIKNDGGAGKNTGIQIRGNNANQTLILLDGLKINSTTQGSARIEHLPLDQVERIEVVRGPRSSLYGSEAIGGVIQIFTRKSKAGFHPEARLGFGSHNTRTASVNLAGGTENTWYNLNAGTEKTDGFNACEPDKGCFYDEPDADGYKRDSVALRVGHHLNADTEAELSFLHIRGDSEYDGAPGANQADTVQQIASVKLKHQLNARTQLSAQLGQAKDNTSNHTPTGELDGRYDSRRDTASLQADIQTSINGAITFGLDKQTDKITASDKAYSRSSRDNDAVFTSYHHQFGQHDVDVALRHDDNEQFGQQQTGSIAAGRDLANGMRITAAYGSAFKAPTFDDLYYPASAFYAPNPNLKPEKSRNMELGISGKLPHGRWSANVFENRVDNLITYISDPVTFAGTMENVNEARIRGIELSATSKLGSWDASGNLTAQNPENLTGTNTGKILSYRPEHIASVDLDRQLDKLHVGATVRGESRRYTDPANTADQKLHGYATLDLRADYQLSKDWTIGAKVGNVLDKDYQTNRGYNQDGINGLVTIKYAPK
ncbi:MAG: TonB-dependent receptor [Gammaproteobacteria bacterium]|nr:TonB-dependent receptor [Gammaproteobacteria bacterium]MBU1725730.1 TonB-dependent receptor [Gammaproteobacteria bacterium]MBU2003918.1 TonB-dependent receptor [Gammaproteobacteria bacterium]